MSRVVPSALAEEYFEVILPPTKSNLSLQAHVENEHLSASSIACGQSRCIDSENSSAVLVRRILCLTDLAVLFLHSHGEGRVFTMALNPKRQHSPNIRATIGRVVFLVPLVIPEHVDAIEIRF